MRQSARIIITVNLLFVLVSPSIVNAYWVWTPETKKFINPKYAVKDTPKEQYDWAMDFFKAKDYQRSAVEFEKLVKNYEYSEYAASAQYHVGLSYDNQAKYYIAFQNYQKAVDNFPHVGNIDEIIAREFEIGNIYASKNSPKVLGAEIMTSFDRAIEIYKKVVDNAPFGKFADEAQFRMAMTMKDASRYDEATVAFQKIIDDYPTSKLYEKARYEMADSAYRASLAPAYDASPTDKALKAFEELASTNADETLNKEAQTTIKRLKNKAAEKSFMTAEFYEQQKHYASAMIYYQDVIDKYPDSISAGIAEVRIADLKAGNYSHKKIVVQPTGVKKGWAPWSAKPKKTDSQAASKEVVRAPSVEVPHAVKEKMAEAVVPPPSVTPAEPQAEAQGPEKDIVNVQEKTDKPGSGKRWWSYGLRDKTKIGKPSENKVKKAWAPLDFGKKTKREK